MEVIDAESKCGRRIRRPEIRRDCGEVLTLPDQALRKEPWADLGVEADHVLRVLDAHVRDLREELAALATATGTSSADLGLAGFPRHP